MVLFCYMYFEKSFFWPSGRKKRSYIIADCHIQNPSYAKFHNLYCDNLLNLIFISNRFKSKSFSGRTNMLKSPHLSINLRGIEVFQGERGQLS